MKSRRAFTGPFRERLHYTSEEIEHLTEDELQKYDLLPRIPSPIDIDLYIERRFLTPRYEDLEPSLLGYTEFGPQGPIDIVINKQLASEPSIVAKRRVRTTIAHEGGHALLHTILYLGTGQINLLGTTEPERPRILCKEEDLHAGYDGKWWEYQANLAMSSFLLPRQLTLTALSPYLTTNILGGRTLDPDSGMRASKTLSDTFDVNPVVVRIRIEQLFNIKLPVVH